MEAHVEDLAFESLAVAGFTGEREVGHELHFHGDDTGTLTFLTTATVGVEGEILGREAHLLGKGLFSKELADGVVGFHIGGGIGARALSDGVLVDHLHMANLLPVAFEGNVFAGEFGHFGRGCL